MIRTLYFICIIFVKKYNYILANINSESGGVIFSFFCLHPVGQTFFVPSKLCKAGPESKIGLSYVNVVCVYDVRGGGRGLEVLKCFVREGQNFFYLLCVCVSGGGGGGGGGSGSVPLLP